MYTLKDQRWQHVAGAEYESLLMPSSKQAGWGGFAQLPSSVETEG